MKKAKKILAVFLALAMTLSLVACDSNSGTGSDTSTVYVEVTSDPGNYQPSTRNAGATSVFLLNVYEGLFEKAYSGE